MASALGIAFLHFCQQDLMGDEEWETQDSSLLSSQPCVSKDTSFQGAVAYLWAKSRREPLLRTQSCLLP